MPTKHIETIARLQDWYASQCNGEWEHAYGISIGTLDNPGWSFKVDLADTYLSGRSFDDISQDGSREDDWYICRVRKNIFEGSCGPHRLSDVIATFLQWAESATPIVGARR